MLYQSARADIQDANSSMSSCTKYEVVLATIFSHPSAGTHLGTATDDVRNDKSEGKGAAT